MSAAPDKAMPRTRAGRRQASTSVRMLSRRWDFETAGIMARRKENVWDTARANRRRIADMHTSSPTAEAEEKIYRGKIFPCMPEEKLKFRLLAP